MLFEYQGIDNSGTKISGTIEAMDRRGAIVQLKGKGHFATHLSEQSTKTRPVANKSERTSKPAESTIFSGKVNSNDVLAFTSQLHTALQSGLPLLDCLNIINKQVTKPALKSLLAQLAEKVQSGDSLSDAMAKHGRTFSPLYLAMIRVGETAGILEQTTGRLVELLKRESHVKSSLKSAAAYPLFVLSIGFISVIVLVTLVLPRIVEMLTSESNTGLPWPTQILMSLSDFATSIYGLILVIGLITALILFKRWTHTPAGQFKWDTFKLKIPIFGNVIKTIAVGRFARTLGSLTHGGIAILEALSVVRDTLGNELLARDIDNVAQKVKTGASVAEPLAESGNFPPLLVQIVSVGEQTGKLDEMLLNAADTFDESSDAAVQRFNAILPAVLILLLALVVGFIVLAMLLPVMVMDLGAGL
ncbi:MAG: type II secretion system F family protein [Phycisphaerae bacterium]|nr:type II secretion system F family protein [Phycisphaerae bacterium]